jgi:hypothetical protein
MNLCVVLFVIVLGMCSPGYGETLTVYPLGTNTSGSFMNLPLDVSSAYNYSQQIYNHSQIVSSGWDRAGYISSNRFYKCLSYAMDNSNDWTIYMANTTNSNFNGITAFITSGLNQVFSGTFPSTPSTGWVDIPLDTPFYYNGTGNLLISVDENSPGTCPYAQIWATSYTSDLPVVSLTSTSNIDPANPGTPNHSYHYPNVIGLTFFDPPLAPQNLHVSTYMYGTSLTWDPVVADTNGDPMFAESYNVYCQSEPNGPFVQIGNTLSTEYTHSGDSLLPFYRAYRVTAVDN